MPLQASELRTVVDSFRDAPASRERTRALIQANRPDIRYLVAHFAGGSTEPIARVSRAVLTAAGAPTGILGQEADLPEGPLEGSLYARSARLAISAAYELGRTRPDLGEATRREIEVVTALTAFAEASMRVVLLLEEGAPGDEALAAVEADIVVLGELAAEDLDSALALAGDGRPVVSAEQDGPVRARIEDEAKRRTLPLLLGGRDFSVVTTGGVCDVTVAGETYAGLPLPAGISARDLASGVAAALGVAALGIRMREEWVAQGVAAVRPSGA